MTTDHKERIVHYKIIGDYWEALGEAEDALAEADAEIERLRAAVLAEREECAKVADVKGWAPTQYLEGHTRVYRAHPYSEGGHDTADSIAAAIRVRPQP